MLYSSEYSAPARSAGCLSLYRPKPPVDGCAPVPAQRIGGLSETHFSTASAAPSSYARIPGPHEQRGGPQHLAPPPREGAHSPGARTLQIGPIVGATPPEDGDQPSVRGRSAALLALGCAAGVPKTAGGGCGRRAAVGSGGWEAVSRVGGEEPREATAERDLSDCAAREPGAMGSDTDRPSGSSEHPVCRATAGARFPAAPGRGAVGRGGGSVSRRQSAIGSLPSPKVAAAV